jgi:hypothetical protein
MNTFSEKSGSLVMHLGHDNDFVNISTEFLATMTSIGEVLP